MFNLFKKDKCKYCYCGYPMKPERIEQTDMRILYGNELRINQSGMPDLVFHANYCPVCGRSIGKCGG